MLQHQVHLTQVYNQTITYFYLQINIFIHVLSAWLLETCAEADDRGITWLLGPGAAADNGGIAWDLGTCAATNGRGNVWVLGTCAATDCGDSAWLLGTVVWSAGSENKNLKIMFHLLLTICTHICMYMYLTKVYNLTLPIFKCTFNFSYMYNVLIFSLMIYAFIL